MKITEDLMFFLALIIILDSIYGEKVNQYIPTEYYGKKCSTMLTIYTAAAGIRHSCSTSGGEKK